MGDCRRLFEYFVIVGLEDGAEDLVPTAQECGCRNSAPLAPITDICVIFPSLGETVPDGFERITSTPMGYAADLNHGSLRTPSVFLCFRRGYHKPPLVDIGVLDEGRGEKPMLDSNTVLTTPFGRSANVNNASPGVFLTYRRAQANSAPSQLVVTHICVILTNKGEAAPHTYYKIPKNLNKFCEELPHLVTNIWSRTTYLGVWLVLMYFCAIKITGTSKRIAYKPAVLDHFPSDNKFTLAQNIPMFCLPVGALIECWPARCQPPDKSFSTFVLTDQDGSKLYGSSVTFYEPYTKPLSMEQMEKLELMNETVTRGMVEDASNTNDPAEQQHVNLYHIKISVFNAFKRFLFYLHRMSLSGAHTVPVERYISHLLYEVSFPSPRCPRVLVQLGNETISFESHDDSQLPLSGAAFSILSNVFDVACVTGTKILVHSLRPWLLTAVAESVCALMFPFHWQCPYIPQCPLSLAGVLHAPLPFIAGVDSRYFDLYEDPPSDVTCFDLDTSTISFSSIRQTLKLSMLPKKASRQLKNSLEKLHRRLYQEEFNVIALRKNMDFMPLNIDYDIQRKKRMLEINVQDAFLRFMASLMQGYTAYLRPIRCAPRCVGATDTGSLFDLDAFLRSRDKSSLEFFKRFSETQSFNRFIEERSFVSDKNTYNAFFDECIAKISQIDNRLSNDSLVEYEMSPNSQTEFVPPPESPVNSDGQELIYKYEYFPRKLEPGLFQLENLRKMSIEMKGSATSSDCLENALIRTKQEARSAVETAILNARHSPVTWPKTLLFYAYSVWFMLLPSLVHLAKSKVKILRLALHILDRMEYSGVLPLDQVCYRIVIQLCGDFGHPILAVKVLQAMQRSGMEQNAVTYGIYHQAVLKGGWPVGGRVEAVRAWNRLAIVVRAISLFKMNLSLVSNRHSLQLDSRISSYLFKDWLPIYISAADNCWSHSENASCEMKENEPVSKELPASVALNVNEDESILDQSSQFGNSVAPFSEGNDSNDPLIDPLGAVNMPQNLSVTTPKRINETMSPSRLQFIKEHSTSPFANELHHNESMDSKLNEKSNSWLRGLTSSPIVSKLMRSNATSNFESPFDKNDSSLTLSPSLASLVNQMKKGYDDVLQAGSLSSRLREGVNTLVNEVRSLNRSYAKDGGESTHSLQREINEQSDQQLHLNDPLFQLDSGSHCSLLPSDWWLADQIFASASAPHELIDIAISSASLCPACKMVVYDEDLMSGWTVDESNLNTSCVYCECAFVPSLTIKIHSREMPVESSWYLPSFFAAKTSDDDNTSRCNGDNESIASQLSVPFLSPLVLRRELENLLSGNCLLPMYQSLRHSNPIVFWNVLYYSRRLSLPTHFPSWLGQSVHVRCVYDVPVLHTEFTPLFFVNPSHKDGLLPNSERSINIWRHVIAAVQQSSILRALQMILSENRSAIDNGKFPRRFPLFRCTIQSLFKNLKMKSLAIDLQKMTVTYWNQSSKFILLQLESLKNSMPAILRLLDI
ncbi:C-myc promoter-binding protein [Dirofilaria immitis]|nr:C-myc promoter-binding protein [Dirofilaria immitis]